MKKLSFLIIAIVICNTINAQIQLGRTENEIKAIYPQRTWRVSYDSKQTRYIYADFEYGLFSYYFDKTTGRCNLCAQIPHTNLTMNVQIQIYNDKYVVTSKTSWTAYLDNGSIVLISLIYDEDTKTSFFRYELGN